MELQTWGLRSLTGSAAGSTGSCTAGATFFHWLRVDPLANQAKNSPVLWIAHFSTGWRTRQCKTYGVPQEVGAPTWKYRRTMLSNVSSPSGSKKA